MPDTGNTVYDVAIIGSGPAGLTASIYASRYKLSNIIFGKVIGGEITGAHKVCNVPGFTDISGIDLGMKMYEHAKSLGGEYTAESIKDIKKENNMFTLISETGKEYVSRTVIIATGTNRNKLNLPKEDYYLGKGLSYCCTCDAMFFRNKTVVVVGGSSAATMAACMLSDIAKKVFIIYRGAQLRGDKTWIDDALSRKNVEVIYTTVVTGLDGKDKLEKIKLSKQYNGSEYLDVDGLFVEIGSEPSIDIPSKLGVDVDEKGYIKVLDNQSTNIDGVWAAGDCTNSMDNFKQVVVACAQGAVASNSIYSYLITREKTPSFN